MMDKMREEFEKWYIEQFGEFKTFNKSAQGEYMALNVQWAWIGWKTAQKQNLQLIKELAKTLDCCLIRFDQIEKFKVTHPAFTLSVTHISNLVRLDIKKANDHLKEQE